MIIVLTNHSMQQYGMAEDLCILCQDYMYVGEQKSDTIIWKNPDGSSADVHCPPMLPNYQWHIHKIDQQISCCNISRKSKSGENEYSFTLLNVLYYLMPLFLKGMPILLYVMMDLLGQDDLSDESGRSTNR